MKTAIVFHILCFLSGFMGTVMRRLLLLLGMLFLPLQSTSQAQAADIVDVAVSSGSFETLVAAVQAAGLVDTLKGDGPYTVFAPTDEAFAALPAGTVDSLLQPENADRLVAVLSNHIVPGIVTSNQIGVGSTYRSLQGITISVIEDRGVRIKSADFANSAGIVVADIEASNGTIHVIDTVLIPTTFAGNGGPGNGTDDPGPSME